MEKKGECFIVLFSFSGCIAFIGVAAYFLTRPSIEIQWQEKAVFSAFFAGAILCMGFSFLFHTMYCHSERVGKLFNKYAVYIYLLSIDYLQSGDVIGQKNATYSSDIGVM